jgi:hypothetical protein
MDRRLIFLVVGFFGGFIMGGIVFLVLIEM